MAYLLMTMIKIQQALKCELNYFSDMMADTVIAALRQFYLCFPTKPLVAF